MSPVSDLIEQTRSAALAEGREIGYRTAFNDFLDTIDEVMPLIITDAATLKLVLSRMSDTFEIRKLDDFRPSQDLTKILNQ